jgi:hypothetical protein
MSNIKNKSIIYAVIRYHEKGGGVVCCFAKTIEGADELCAEYQQQWADTGGDDSVGFYVVGNIFYDK